MKMNTHNPNCISDADLSRLLENDLEPTQRQALQQHLERCPACHTRWEAVSSGARRIENLFSRSQETSEKESPIEQSVEETEYWWSQFVGSQILYLLAQVPEEIDSVLQILGTTTSRLKGEAQIIQLSLLEPVDNETLRLAAAMGEGFAEQILTQEDPPYEFHLVQFGQQLRIDIQALSEAADHQDCLARVELFEAERCIHSRIVLVEKGKSQLILEPDALAALQPQQQRLSLQLQPLVSLDQLAAAGAEAYLPILTKLLAHSDPQIRLATIAVIARLYGPQAPKYLQHLTDDPDESVRQAVDKVITQATHPPQRQE